MIRQLQSVFIKLRVTYSPGLEPLPPNSPMSTKVPTLDDPTGLGVSRVADDPNYRGNIKDPIANPNAPKRIAWDVISPFLEFYDLVTVPLELFEPAEPTLRPQ